MAAYTSVGEEELWKNLEYFLQHVIPFAASVGIKMALHPDDPPRPIFGLPRIVKNRNDLRRILDAVDAPANGLTLCSGALGADVRNDIVAMVKEFGGEKRIHFAHLRNIQVDERGNFQETAHYSASARSIWLRLFAPMLKLVSTVTRARPRPHDLGRKREPKLRPL